MKKNKKIFILIFVLILVAQLLFKIYIDCKKEDFFIDEFYSYALMNYKIPFIFNEETFLNTWHSNDYFKDYVVINENEVWDWTPVYTNQIQDVHPPFYYFLLRIFSTFFIGIFSKWPGLILNLIIYVFSAIAFYKVAEKLLKSKWYALIALFTYGFSLFSTENTLYIRMYQLLELELLILTYWHLDNYSKELKPSNLIPLGLMVTFGFLTHYYYITFVIALYIIYLVHYIKSKNTKSIFKYTGTLLLSGIAILIIFPYCLSHLFSGYRGANSLYRLFNFTNLWYYIKEYFNVMNIHVFAHGFKALIFILVLTKLAFIVRSSVKAKKFTFKPSSEVIITFVPTVFYIFFVIKSAPFIDIRYISPVLIYVVLFIVYMMKSVLSSILKNGKVIFTISLSILVVLTIPSLVSHNRLLYLYYGNQKVLDDLKNNYGSLPCVYVYNETTEMFNNFVYNYNFLLQSDNVYLTSSITPESAKEIMSAVDTSNGMLLYDSGINIHNLLRFTELDQFNSYKVVDNTYNGLIFYIYYDENLEQ